MNATPLTSIPAEIRERIAERISLHSGTPDSNGCVPWTLQLDRHGYGKFRFKYLGRAYHSSAHRVAWILEHGEIADPGLVLDHLCRNRACINTAHIELVSTRENILRGAIPLSNREKLGLPRVRTNPAGEREHCKHGHPWSVETIYQRVDRHGYIHRTCKKCSRERFKEWQARQAA